MRHVRVLIPFMADGKLLEAGKEYDLEDNVVARANRISVNMLLDFGEAKPKAEAKPKTKTTK